MVKENFTCDWGLACLADIGNLHQEAECEPTARPVRSAGTGYATRAGSNEFYTWRALRDTRSCPDRRERADMSNAGMRLRCVESDPRPGEFIGRTAEIAYHILRGAVGRLRSRGFLTTM